MKKRAFTLIELLVVVSIIAILAALLMPAISGASATAKQSKCASNLSQLFLALNLYAQDHSGLIVYSLNGSFSGDNWTNDIAPYIQLQGTKAVSGNGGTRPASILACPASTQLDYAGTYSDYGKNIYINGNAPPNAQPYQGYANVHITGLANPSQIMLFGDSIYRDIHLFFTQQNPPGGPMTDANGITYRHKGCANILYYDGHVGTVLPGVIPTWAMSPASATKYPWCPYQSE